MDDSDLEELLKKKYEQEMNIFSCMNCRQTVICVGATNAAISSLRLPTSVPSWDN